MTGLLDCVNSASNMTIIILDNETTGMTGGQSSSCTGRIESICEGIGVAKGHIRTIVPLKKNHDEMVETIRNEIAYPGVSVIIARRECVQILKRKNK
jgi:indolepyruvate ferredoxin oxidoreductase alpha subunit